MIEIYTDGSFYKDNDSVPSRICAGTGVVIRCFDQQYPNEILHEEYYSFRYSLRDLGKKISDKIGMFQCFDDISSTLIECIGLCEGMTLINNSYLLDDINIYVDDISLKKILSIYIDLVSNNIDINNSEYQGSILCMIDELFDKDLSILNRIKIFHVKSHKDNIYNNMADYLASYRTRPVDRVTTLLIRNTEFVSVSDKKQYYLYLQQLRK